MNNAFKRLAMTGAMLLATAPFVATVVDQAGAAPRHKCSEPVAAAKSWSFGVMADTQWTNPPGDDGKNPNTVAVDIIRQVNSQFINRGVKFVVQAGDVTDKQSPASLATTAVFRQDLYNAGIGFYPLRGNHESSAASALDFTRLFPQTQTATMNATPADAFSVANPDAATQPCPARQGAPFTAGTISAAPAAPAGFGGLCYAVDYNNARLVFLDQFTPTTGVKHSTLDRAQVDWMNGQLSGRATGTHAFVFGHKGILTENHVDTLFGANPTVEPALQNAFIGGLDKNGVRYYMGGHDHIHNRALVKSVDGTSSVQDITLASDSSKFYIPYGSAGYERRVVDPLTKLVSVDGILAAADPAQTNDAIYNVAVAGGAPRETEIAQELNTVGYYIFMVTGPQVQVDYYSAVVNPTYIAEEGEYQLATTPKMTFSKRESFGYSLNGEQFLVAQGDSYTKVNDTFAGTTARIISGVNGSTASDAAGRAFTKTVNTGWTTSTRSRTLSSNILTLWGMEDLGSATTDAYTLSLNYNVRHNGPGILVARDADGRWVNAVQLNSTGQARFVQGPWKASYGLGTYGIDPRTRSAWAVLDYDGAFAISHHAKRHVER